MVEWFQRLLSYYDYIRPVIDVGLLGFLIYKGYQVLVKTQAVQLVKGLSLMVAVYGAAYVLQLHTLSWILNLVAPGIIIALAILFQPELRKVIMRLGQGGFFRQGGRVQATQLDAVMNAAEMLSSRRRGALIVFPRKVNLKNIVDTGTRLGADLSSAVLLTIFGHDTPLHDGAAVIQGSKVLAAGCLLPLSEQQDIRRSFGTRHRAALGLSEEADAVVLVVSEESGALSLAVDSKLYYNLTPRALRARLEELLDSRAQAPLTAVEESLGE
jgi:diadenylate cyclase